MFVCVPYMGSLYGFLIWVPYWGSLLGFLNQVPYLGSLFGFFIQVPYLSSLFRFLFEFLTGVPSLGLFLRFCVPYLMSMCGFLLWAPLSGSLFRFLSLPGMVGLNSIQSCCHSRVIVLLQICTVHAKMKSV